MKVGVAKAKQGVNDDLYARLDSGGEAETRTKTIVVVDAIII